jgi:hypothetical protein
MPMTDLLADAFLEHLTGSDFTAPSDVYLRLCDSPAGPDGSGNPVGDGVAMTWSAASGGQITSDVVAYGVVDASDARQIVGWRVETAASGGDALLFGNFSAPAVVAAGKSVEFPAGRFVWRATSGVPHATFNAWADHVLRDDPWTAPGGLWAALFTTVPDLDGSGGVEVTGGGYARQAVSLSTPGPAGGMRGSANDTPVEWEPVHTGAAQSLTGWGLFDDDTAGDLLVIARFVPAVEVDVDDDLVADVAELEVRAR